MAKQPSLASEIARILECTPAHRARGIIDSPYTRQILEQLPPQEAYLVIKEAWGMDSQILLQYVPADTVCRFMDLDCWDKDTLSVDSLIEWLQELYYTSMETLLETIEAMDVELLVMVYQNCFEVVHVRPTDEHIPELINEGFESIDNQYYYRVTSDDERTPLLKEILNILFTSDHDLYVTILEAVMCELPSYLEETSYEKRSLRLMEMGFPRPEDAVEVYRRVDIDNLLGQGIRKEKTPVVTKHLHMLPARYVEQFSRSRSLLVKALQQTSENTRERFVYEMVYLTNKIVMADFRPLNDGDALKASMEKAGSLCSLGLLVASRAKSMDPAVVLDTTNAETLFAIGYNSVLSLQHRLRRILDHIERSMIPERISKITEGLLRKRPLYRETEFSSLEELDEVSRELDRLEAMASLCRRLDWERAIPSLGETNTGVSLDVEAVILTSAVANTVSGESRFRPLTRSELTRFLTTATATKKNRRIVKDAFMTHLPGFLMSLGGDIEADTARDIAHIVLERLEFEIGGIRDITGLDPRFITCLIVRL